MMPEAAIAFACRSAIAVSCGAVLTVDRPCACRYREITSAMSSACASVDVIATTAPSNTALITRFPPSPAMKQQSLAPDEADIGHRIGARIVAAALNQQIFLPRGALCWEVTPHRAAPPETSISASSAV